MASEALDGDFGGTFPFEARYLSAGDIRLHYVDEGPRDAQPLRRFARRAPRSHAGNAA